MVQVSNGDFPWADGRRQMVTNLFSKHLLNANKSGFADFRVHKANSSLTLMEQIIVQKIDTINT